MLEPLEDADSHAALAPPTRRRGLRFSILGLVWLLTVASLGIGLYRTGSEVVPLRNTVEQLRSELGVFSVEDPLKVAIVRNKVKIPTAWRWRMYLPTGRLFTMRYFLGSAPELATLKPEDWSALLRPQSHDVGRSLETGEFNYEALLLEYDQRTWLRAGTLSEDGATFQLPAGYEWLLDETAWVVSSDASYQHVTQFDVTMPVMLLQIERSIHADDADGAGAGAEAAAAGGKSSVGERFVLWIDVQ